MVTAVSVTKYITSLIWSLLVGTIIANHVAAQHRVHWTLALVAMALEVIAIILVFVNVVCAVARASASNANRWKAKAMSPYSIVYADPPWHFRVRSEKGEGRSAKQHYSVMSIDDIANMPIAEIAADNSVCLMWVIDPMIEQGYQVMRAWGFIPKTVGFYWVKENMKSEGFFTGLGYYTRANPEQCILGVRGKGLPRKDKGVKRLIVAPRGRHSEKPEEARIRIERLFGDVSRVELFARSKRIGWDVFGNQVEGSIRLPTMRAPDLGRAAAQNELFD